MTNTTTYFTPDRSNRPGDSKDLYSSSFETPPQKDNTHILLDGRIAIKESATMSRHYASSYFYFDATDLEHATTEELAKFMRASGIDWWEEEGGRRGFSFVGVSAHLTKDAQQRTIWEFTITYSLDD